MKLFFKKIQLFNIPPVVILNYLILLTALVMYTNTSLNPPDIKLRVAFLVLLILPLFKYAYLTPIVLTLFVSIRQFSVAPFSYIPTTPEYYFVIIILISIAHYAKYSSDNNKLSYELYGLLISPFFSNIININLNYEFLMYVLIVILVVKFINHPLQIKFLEFCFPFVTLILSIYAIVFADDFIPEYAIYLDVERSYWTDPNYLGAFFSIGIIVSFYNVIDFTSNKLLLLFYSTTMLLGFIALGIIASRGALITSLIPMIYILLVKTNSFKRVFINTVLVLVFVYFGLKYMSLDALIDRFNDDTLATGNDRSFIWSNSFQIFLNSDFHVLLFGGGTNHALEICGKVMREDVYSPHNNYLQVLYDYGIVGLVLFIVFFRNLFLKNKENVLVVAILFSFVLTCFTLVPLMYMPFWMVLAYIIGAQKLNQDNFILKKAI